MKEKRRKMRGGSRPVFRCTKRVCQIFRSMRHGNFFHYIDYMKVNCKLTLFEILELIFYFVKIQLFALTEEMTGKARMTVCD